MNCCYKLTSNLNVQATAEANNLSAVAAAKETYHQLMEAVCGGAKPYLSTAHLETEHLRIKDKAMELFTKKPKMGGEEFSKQYRDKLDEVSLSLSWNFWLVVLIKYVIVM